MKSMKSFVKTCFSEYLLSETEEANALSDENGDAVTKAGEKVPYLGGLGLKFKFPGDAKKSVFCGCRVFTNCH
jgi:TBC1 domain family member 8/9